MKFEFFVLSLLIIQSANSQTMQVTARSMNVRTADGQILCGVKRDDKVEIIGRHADGSRLKVKIDRAGCPAEGYVYSSLLRPIATTYEEASILKVDIDSLTLRSSTKVSPETYKCSLPRNTIVEVLDDAAVGSHRSQWYKVKILKPLSGCPTEGFVNGAYLSLNKDLTKIPVAKDSQNSLEIEKVTEAKSTCVDCQKQSNAMADLGKISKELTRQNQKNDFISGLRELIQNPKVKVESLITHRGLVQMPLIGSMGNIGPCGSHHYSPDQPVGIDAYANPVTACAFTSFLQDWKKNKCPNSEDGCRVAWGDISHKTRPKYNGHVSHTDGQCIDIRPMRQGKFQDYGLQYQDKKSYDQPMTTEMIKMLKEKGASVLYFNDKKSGGEYMTNHDNHIHVCFPNNDQTQKVCNDLTIDPNVCEELQ